MSTINSELSEYVLRIPIENGDAYKLVSRLHDKVEIMETKYLSKSIKLRIRANRSEIDKLQKSLNGNYSIKKDAVG